MWRARHTCTRARQMPADTCIPAKVPSSPAQVLTIVMRGASESQHPPSVGALAAGRLLLVPEQITYRRTRTFTDIKSTLCAYVQFMRMHMNTSSKYFAKVLGAPSGHTGLEEVSTSSAAVRGAAATAEGSRTSDMARTVEEVAPPPPCLFADPHCPHVLEARRPMPYACV